MNPFNVVPQLDSDGAMLVDLVAVDKNLNFHPDVLVKIAQGIGSVSSDLQHVMVITGTEPRPESASLVFWIGGNAEPVNMAAQDLWFSFNGNLYEIYPKQPELLTSASVFGSNAPPTSLGLFGDGNGSLQVGNRFYTTRSSGVKVIGARVWIPEQATLDVLNLDLTANVYLDTWSGSYVTGQTTFNNGPLTSKTKVSKHVAGSWAEIFFDEVVVLNKISSGNVNDLLTISYGFGDGKTYLYGELPSLNVYASSDIPGVFLSENADIGRGINTMATGYSVAYYGIDILFELNESGTVS